MQPFDLALRLRMARAAMPEGDIEPDQPGTEVSQRLQRVGDPPRRTVVGQDRPREAILGEQARQQRLDGHPLLVGTGHQAQTVARMVINHDQRMDASLAQRQMAHEVQLP